MNTAVHERLARAAQAREFVFIGEIAEMVGLDTSDPDQQLELVRTLDEIDRHELSKGRPILSSIAVRQEDHLPGPEVYLLGRELSLYRQDETDIDFATRQIQLTHDAWAEIPPFGEATEPIL